MLKCFLLFVKPFGHTLSQFGELKQMFGALCQIPVSKEEKPRKVSCKMYQKLLGHQRIPKKQGN